MTEFISLELAISIQGLKINGVNYKANIQFDNNEIIVCDETKENAEWFIEFFDDASVFKNIQLIIKIKNMNYFQKVC